MAASGPSRTRLGISSICSTRNRPGASSTVALLAVPPLSRPTTTHCAGSVILCLFHRLARRKRSPVAACLPRPRSSRPIFHYYGSYSAVVTENVPRSWRAPASGSVFEGLGWRAGADQVAVTVGLVDAADRRPVLGPLVAWPRVGQNREGALLALVGMLPVRREQHGRGVRRVPQRVVLWVVLACGHLGDLLPDCDHGGAEPVDLGEVLALGRLDHQRPGHRERHGRSVEPVVDQAFRHVLHGDAGFPGD